MITADDLLDLQNVDFDLMTVKISKYIGKARYQHCQKVAELCTMIAEDLLPHRVEELFIAGLLHDVAKELSYGELMSLLKYRTDLTPEDYATTAALHSFAGAELIKKEFPEFATQSILSAVNNHTLGNRDMPMFDKILFVSDFLAHKDTISEAELLFTDVYRFIKTGRPRLELAQRFNSIVKKYIDMTEDRLNSLGIPLHSRTKALRESILPDIYK